MYLTTASWLCGVVRHLNSCGNSRIRDHIWPGRREVGQKNASCWSVIDAY